MSIILLLLMALLLMVLLIVVAAVISVIIFIRRTPQTIAELEQQNSLGRTIDEVLRHEGSTRSDLILMAIHARIDQKLAALGDENASDAEWKFYAIEEFERDVNNGGFDQYFMNSSGDSCAVALEGLREIGASRTAVLLERAMSVFPSGSPPADRDKRRAAMEMISGRARPVWEQCDSEFFELDEPIGDLLLEYTKRNKSCFVFHQDAN